MRHLDSSNLTYIHDNSTLNLLLFDYRGFSNVSVRTVSTLVESAVSIDTAFVTQNIQVWSVCSIVKRSVVCTLPEDYPLIHIGWARNQAFILIIHTKLIYRSNWCSKLRSRRKIILRLNHSAWSGRRVFLDHTSLMSGNLSEVWVIFFTRSIQPINIRKLVLSLIAPILWYLFVNTFGANVLNGWVGVLSYDFVGVYLATNNLTVCRLFDKLTVCANSRCKCTRL